MMKTYRILEWYEQGIITVREALFRLCQNMTEEDFKILSEDWKSQLRDFVDHYPKTDADWEGIKSFSIEVRTGPGPTQEEKRKEFRSAVENMREIFNE